MSPSRWGVAALLAVATLLGALPGAQAQAGTNITLFLNYPVPTFNGTVINVTARLTDNNLVPIPGVNITFSTVGQPNAGSGSFTTDTNGTARAFVAYNFAGNYTVNATFPGNQAFLPSQALASVLVYYQTLIPPVANPNPVGVGTSTVITPTLTALTPNGALPVQGATVTLDYGDGSTGTFTTDANGQVAANHTYAVAGNYTVTAGYAGTNGGTNSSTNPPLYASSGTTQVIVQPSNTTGGTLSIAVQPPLQPPYYLTTVPITVVSQLLDSNGQPVNNAQIQFTNSKGQTLPAITNSTGFATAVFTIPAGQQGQVTFTATTVGRNPTLTQNQTVPVYQPTTTVLSVSPNPASTGQTVTYTATVSPTATGSTVTFNFGDGTSQAVVLTGSTATVTKVYSTANTYAVSATTSDNLTNFLLGSASSATSLVINGTPTPSPTPSPPTPTPSVTPSPPTPTPSVTPSPPTPTPSVTPSPPTPTPSVTPSPPTPTPSVSPSPPTPTPTPSPSGGNITVVVSANPGAIVYPECASLDKPITFTANLVPPSNYTGAVPAGFVTFIIIQQSTGQALNLGTVPVNAPTQPYQTTAYAQIKVALSVPAGFYNVQAIYLSSNGLGQSSGTLFNFYVDKKCEKEDYIKDHWYAKIGDALKDNWWQGSLDPITGDLVAKANLLGKGAQLLLGGGKEELLLGKGGSGQVVYPTPATPIVYQPGGGSVTGQITGQIGGGVSNVTYAQPVYPGGSGMASGSVTLG